MAGPVSPWPMNPGQALGDMVLAAIIGRMKNVSVVSRWLGLYSPKGLAATTFVNKYIGTDDASDQGNGAIVAPFKTLGAAVSAMGKVKTQAGFEQPRTIVVEGGTHDVSAVTLPMGRWIIVLQGGAKLTGTLKQELVVAEAFTSTLPPGVAIINPDDIPAGASFDSVTFVQGAGAAITNAYLYARNCATEDVAFSPATLTTTSVELDRCLVGEMTNTTAVLVMWDCSVERVLSVKQIELATSSLFGFNITVLAASEFHDCRFSATPRVFTGPASSLRIDGNSNFSFKVGPWTLSTATKVIITDLVA